MHILANVLIPSPTDIVVSDNEDIDVANDNVEDGLPMNAEGAGAHRLENNRHI